MGYDCSCPFIYFKRLIIDVIMAAIEVTELPTLMISARLARRSRCVLRGLRFRARLDFGVTFEENHFTLCGRHFSVHVDNDGIFAGNVVVAASL